MKDHVNIYEARTHFSKIIERAEHGETIVIARNNVPIVEMRPVKVGRAELAERFRALRERVRNRNGGKSVLRPGETWRDLIDEGRRY
ncbi:MAG: type II toxin-antitoxin system Phd/YefM family antitoxin [Vulcanimicrobiaceae bacterium]